MKYLLQLFTSIFSKSCFYSFNMHLYKLSLRSLGVLNSNTAEATGEPWFLHRLQKAAKDGEVVIRLIIDVGANDLAYGQAEFPKAKIYAFEPHPDSFQRLKQSAARKVIPIQAAVGDREGRVDFWDLADDASRKHEQPTSQLASVHREVIEKLYKQSAKKYRVKMTTLDSFAKTHKIKHIDLLKIDAEGNELAVLQGAHKLLTGNNIDIVQFEFNEIHAYSRVFMKDFCKLLHDYDLYRLLPKGTVKLKSYRPLTHEIFGFQNIVAVRKDLHCHL